jgi:hypothetical protein
MPPSDPVVPCVAAPVMDAVLLAVIVTTILSRLDVRFMLTTAAYRGHRGGRLCSQGWGLAVQVQAHASTVYKRLHPCVPSSKGNRKWNQFTGV